MAINIETLLKDVKEKGYNVVKEKDRAFICVREKMKFVYPL